MTVKVAINGFGRIGRHSFRALIESKRSDIEVVAINDLGSVADNAHLLKYDSVHGRLRADVKFTDKALVVDGKTVRVVAEPKPEKLPWKDMGVDIVFECTGRFVTKEAAGTHLAAGAKKVLVSAPAKGVDKTIVFGVNDKVLTAADKIVSNASCTTNCLSPVAFVLHKTVGIERGYMTTIHSYTGDQRIVDTLHSDIRRARAAALSMIPTKTGAAEAVGLVLPELNGKLQGSSIRVPTPNVSLVDLTFVASRPTSVEAVNKAVKEASETPGLKGILAYTEEKLVSVDFNHDSHSSTFDGSLTTVIDGTFVRIVAWYDNEWGFSNRMGDTAVAMHKAGY